MNTRIRSAAVLSALAMGLAVPAAALADDVATVPIAGTRLDISAEGEVTRAPDIATLSAGVVTQAATAASAMADNAKTMAATVAALKRAGVADKDIRTASLSLQPQYRYADNQPAVVTGYQASNQLTVTFRDIKQAGPILDTLVAQGVNQISGPDFALEHPDAAMDEARIAAMRKARAKADLYARASGMTVKRIVAINEGGGYSPQPPRPVFMMARAAPKVAESDLQPGEEKIGVTVNVTFELQ
ncbi:SIMPL domain-containing protein [Sphingomonas abietis]|uniref:SIMPL domain-containing protein n=1 Tax=Sphingomonas abietis TaxID=3012344 RepID=A0ABY7NNW7_9SPHN|nr:SIMPL domain-containing protein [Sphingomonas abietis]WBO23058.1 SIMPL domain-containing protein [Sphingomonas abietis]